MGTNTLAASQESDLYSPDVFNQITNDVPEWSGFLGEDDLLQEEKYGPQQVMPTAEQYIDQMPLPPPPPQPVPVSAPVPTSFSVRPALGNCPSLDEYRGEYNFQMERGLQGSKNIVFSDTLRKIFIDVNQSLPLRFKWNPQRNDLFLRAMLVYSFDEYRAEPVKRCLNHQGERNVGNQNVSPDMINHVVRCTDPRSAYIQQNGHNCIILPLGTPHNGSEYVTLTYKFFCKNSCMSRRSTDLVFTLENAQGEVLGRQKLNIRVCSCPKRDKEKEEDPNQEHHSSSGRKRRINSHGKMHMVAPPPGKRLMLPAVQQHQPPMQHHVSTAIDNREYLLQIKVLGQENARLTLQAAHGFMASSAAISGEHASYIPYLQNIQSYMQQLP